MMATLFTVERSPKATIVGTSKQGEEMSANPLSASEKIFSKNLSRARDGTPFGFISFRVYAAKQEETGGKTNVLFLV